MKYQSIIKKLSQLAIFIVLFAPFVAGALTASTTISSIIGATISLTSSGSTVAIDVTTASGAKQSTASNVVTVSTNDTAGYQLTLQSNASALTCAACGSTTIPAVAGTCASPVSLSTNSWGYRIVTGAATNTTNFPCNATTAFGTTVPTTGLNQTVSAETYAAVPTASADMIKQTTITASNDTTTIYYKANVDTTKASGTYNGVTITYTSIAR